MENHPSRTFGFNNLGLYGGKIDTTYTCSVPEIQIADFSIGEHEMNINKTSKSTIGTDFLKNYLITIDWPGKTVYFESVSNASSAVTGSFGFNVIIRDGKLVIAQLLENSSAFREGLSLGDQTLKVNEKEYSGIQKSDYCEILKNGIVADEVNVIELTYKNAAGERTLRLNREQDLN